MAVVPYGPRKVLTAPLPAARKTAGPTELSAGVGIEGAKADLALAKGRAGQVIGGAITQVGETLGRVSQSWGELGIKMREEETERADEIMFLGAQRQLMEWKQQWTLDPETGALTKHGKDSLTLPEEGAAAFAKVSGEIAATLTNDRQRIAFGKMASQQALNLDLDLRRHVYGEMQKLEAAEVQATVVNFTNEAIAHATEPHVVGQSLQGAINAIRTHGPALGLGPEQITQQVAAVQTQIHVGVIESLLAQGLTPSAEVYFEETRDQITGVAIARMEKALEEGTIEQQVRAQAARIIAEGGTLTEQREKAGAIEDAKVSKAVLQRIEHEDAVNDKIGRDLAEADLRKAYDIVDRTGSINGIDPALRVKIAEHMPALRAFALSRARGVPVETNWPVYYGLMTKAGEHPEAFIKENMLSHLAELGETEFKQLTSLQLAIRSADTKAADKALAGFRTNGQVFDDTLTLWGYDVNAKFDTPQGKAIAQVRRLLDQRVEAAQQPDVSGKRREVTNIEVQTTLDQIMGVSERIPGSAMAILRPFTYDWADKTKRIIDYTIMDVPEAARNAIRLELQKYGIPVNDQNILNVFVERRTKLR